MIQNTLPKFRAVAAVLAAGALGFNAAAQCNINMAATQQTIDGFGFSSAWCGTLSSAKNNALYGTLGMSLLRVQVDSGGNWTAEINNANAAHAAGAKVLGSVWYVPSQWNNSDGHLDPSHYDDYGNWLNEAASAHGLDWVSPANEPDIGWQPWTQSELMAWICQSASLVGKPIVAPEAVNWSESYSDPFYEDSCSGSKISIAAGHLYGGGISVHSAALDRGKRVWATEYYFTSPNSIDTCMTEAKQITDCMYNQFSAYILWWVNDNDTDTLIVDSNGNISKTGYTFGQFAKWIRPGSSRVTADYNPQSNVYVTAYKVNNGTVIVAVNLNTSSVNQQFNIQNGNAATLKGYRTSSSQSMADIGSFTVSGGSFTASLPAQSVTTFVQTSSVTNGVTFYQNYNYGGSASQALGVGSYTMSQLAAKGVVNDWASSVKVPSGYVVTMYQHDNFSGTSWTLTADKSEFGSIGANDQVSSVVVGLNVTGTRKIVARHSGKAMDAYGQQTGNGTQIQQWTYWGGSNQKWTVSDTGSGYYKIMGVQSGKSLDIDYSSGGTANGTKVQLWDYWNGASQQFKFTLTDSGYFRITPNCATGSCLDVSGISTSDGAKIHLWQWLGGNNQQWALQAP